MRLLAISGSLRRDSYNSALLRAAAAECPPDVGFRFWRGLAQIPAYNEDLNSIPLPVVVLRTELAHADAVLFATPEYNGSVPGALKNALDWVSRPIEANPLCDKPAAVVGASQGIFGALWAQAELRKILRTIGAQVDDRELIVACAQHAFTDDRRLRDPQLASGLRTIIDELVHATRRRAA
jgi:chromate reductase